MMRLVLDTSIIVSGILSPDGVARAHVEFARRGQVRLVSSPGLLDELADVMAVFVSAAAAAECRAAIEDIADVVTPRDPEGDDVMAAAASGRAGVVVTRDASRLRSRGNENTRSV